MKLQEFIEKYGIRKSAIAKRLGISYNQMLYLTKKNNPPKPSLKVAAAIMAYTEGQVTIFDLLPKEDILDLEMRDLLLTENE